MTADLLRLASAGLAPRTAAGLLERHGSPGAAVRAVVGGRTSVSEWARRAVDVSAAARRRELDGLDVEFITASDRSYPEKLARQVRVLGENPELALVSTGMAIVDGDQHLVRVRTTRDTEDGSLVVATMAQLGPTPVPHAPSMIRMALAKQARYGTSQRQPEDADFLLQVLMGRRYGVLAEPLYA